MDTCGHYLKLGGDEHIFRSSVQVLLWIKAVFASSRIVTLQKSKGDEQVRDETLLDQRKQTLAFFEKPPLIQSPPEPKKCLPQQHVQAVNVWKRGSDLDRMFLNVSYNIQKRFDQGFSPNISVTLGGPKISFVESVFDMERPANGSGRHPSVYFEKKPASFITHVIRKFCSPGGTVIDFRMGTGLTAKALLSESKHINCFGCEANDFCISK